MQQPPKRSASLPRAAARPTGHSTAGLLITAVVSAWIPIGAYLVLKEPEPTALADTRDARLGADAAAELTRLRAERAQWQLANPAPPTIRDTPTMATPAEDAPPAVAARTTCESAAAAVDLLLEELTTLRDSGALRSHFLHSPASLGNVVLGALIDARDTQRAAALAQALPDGMVDSSTIARLVKELKVDKDAATARQVLLNGIGRGDCERWQVKEIAGLDPEAGLAQLRTANLSDPLGPASDFATHELELLLACGRMEEAKALLKDLAVEPPSMEGDEEYPSWFELLLTRSPALAVEALQRVPHGELEAHDRALFAGAAAKAAGDKSGAAARLAEAIRLDPESPRAWELLAEVDSAEALRLTDTLRAADHASVSVRRAELLARAGRTDEAVALLQPFETTRWGDVSRVLLRANPELALAKGRERRDDELIGDVADAAWRAGDRDRAAELWREAARIDPRDPEWRGNLRAIATGRDPLNDF